MTVAPIAGGHTAMVYGQMAMGRDMSPQAAGQVASTQANATALRKLMDEADEEANTGIKDVGEAPGYDVPAKVGPRNHREGEAGAPRRRIDVLA